MDGFLAFLANCVAPANFTYTLLMVLLILYWIGVICGGLDVEAGTPDFDLDMDVDADVDLDADADAHADADGHAHDLPAWMAVLKFFNIGEVPLMVFVSFFVPCAWALSLTVTERFGGSGSWLTALALAVPVFIVSAFVAKLLSTPFKTLFRAMNRDVGLVNKEALVGREAVVISLEVTEHSGQVEVSAAGAPLALNARSRPGAVLRKGDRVAITAELDDDKGIYGVEKM